MRCMGAGPTAGERPPPNHPQGATADGVSARNAGMPSAPGQPRGLALQCTWSAYSCSECAPGQKTLRTSGGHTQNECGTQGRRARAKRAWHAARRGRRCGRSAGGAGWPRTQVQPPRISRECASPAYQGGFISGNPNISRIISLIAYQA